MNAHNIKDIKNSREILVTHLALFPIKTERQQDAANPFVDIVDASKYLRQRMRATLYSIHHRPW